MAVAVTREEIFVMEGTSDGRQEGDRRAAMLNAT
jgi:hypothetical protein